MNIKQMTLEAQKQFYIQQRNTILEAYNSFKTVLNDKLPILDEILESTSKVKNNLSELNDEVMDKLVRMLVSVGYIDNPEDKVAIDCLTEDIKINTEYQKVK